MAGRALMTELLEATRDAHDRLEALPYSVALSRHELPIESYVGHLRTMAVIHSVLEHELPVEFDTRIASVWDDSMRRLPALKRDLDYFASSNTRDIPASHTVANRIADRLFERSLESPLSMLGYLYVFEGSSLGGRVLSHWVSRTFNLTDGRGYAYLQPYGDDLQSHWQTFAGRMNQLQLSDRERAMIVDAAQEAFRLVSDLFDALYPFDNDALVFSVGGLNPEAGAHPIPQDPREIEAAQRAGSRCLAEYPYFVERYGERGRRFTDSDGAWLVTLATYDQARIDRQITWLAKVLATRGMPRNLLQRHLELLYEELQRLIPENETLYQKLLIASRRLGNERRGFIDDGTLLELAHRFADAVKNDKSADTSGVAAILVNAVIDEASGLTGTLDSVCSWFCEPSRFSPAWQAAVRHCVADAQAVLGNRD